MAQKCRHKNAEQFGVTIKKENYSLFTDCVMKARKQIFCTSETFIAQV
jgi:hypothetical protein